MKHKEIFVANLDWLKDNYSKYTNPELAKMLGINFYSFVEYASQFGLKKNREVYVEIGKANAAARVQRAKERIEANAKWIEENYQTLTQGQIAKHVGVGIGYLYNFLRKQEWYKTPPTDLFRGKTEEERQEIIAKRAATRHKTRIAEQRRVHWGFEQKTKLRVTGKFTDKSLVRSALRKLGYQVGYAAQVAVVLPDTQRHANYERKAHKHGITVVDENGNVLNKAI